MHILRTCLMDEPFLLDILYSRKPDKAESPVIKEVPSSLKVVISSSFFDVKNNFLCLDCTQQTFVGLEDLLKTSLRHVLETPSKHSQRNNAEDVFKTCLEDILKTCFEDILKTCLEDILNTCLEDVLKTLWRITKYLLEISVSKKSKCVSIKSIFHISISDNSKANPKCTNYNPVISIFVLFWNSSSIPILRIKISDDWVGVVKSAEFKIDIAEKVRQ